MKFSKNVNNRKCAPKIIFFYEKNFRKIQIIFDFENWLWKSEFCNLGQLLLFTKLKFVDFNFIEKMPFSRCLKEKKKGNKNETRKWYSSAAADDPDGYEIWWRHSCCQLETQLLKAVVEGPSFLFNRGNTRGQLNSEWI